jgi:hypothetical protein
MLPSWQLGLLTFYASARSGMLTVMALDTASLICNPFLAATMGGRNFTAFHLTASEGDFRVHPVRKQRGYHAHPLFRAAQAF